MTDKEMFWDMLRETVNSLRLKLGAPDWARWQVIVPTPENTHEVRSTIKWNSFWKDRRGLHLSHDLVGVVRHVGNQPANFVVHAGLWVNYGRSKETIRLQRPAPLIDDFVMASGLLTRAVPIDPVDDRLMP